MLSLERGDVGFAQRGVGGLDYKPTAIGHRVARIEAKIEQRIFELIGVGVCTPQPVGQHGLENDCLANRSTQQLANVRDEFVGVQGLRRQRLLAREGEETCRQRGRAPCALHRHIPSPLHSGQSERIGQVRHLATDDVEAAHDQGQQIVEIVRDAPRQLPNRVHLLRLMQLLFKTTPLRHVVGADNDAAESARLLGRWRNNRLDHRVALGSLVSVRRSRLKACR